MQSKPFSECLQNESKCVHHWILPRPNGRYTEGVCKKCDETRQFQNTPEWMYNSGKTWTTRNTGSYADRVAQGKSKGDAKRH